MPKFAVYADHVPTAFLTSIGFLSSGPGHTVYGQAAVEVTTNTGFIRLSATDEGVVPLVDWLNNHRHHDGRNELRAPAHILYSLKTGLEGAWDYSPERPHQIGPTSLFALIAGFIDVFLSASQFKSEGGIGTLERWNQAFQEMSSEVFALHYAHPGARPKVDTVVRALHRALTSTA